MVRRADEGSEFFQYSKETDHGMESFYRWMDNQFLVLKTACIETW